MKPCAPGKSIGQNAGTVARVPRVCRSRVVIVNRLEGLQPVSFSSKPFGRGHQGLLGVSLPSPPAGRSARRGGRTRGRGGCCVPVCWSSKPSVLDRVSAAVPYILPLFDGLRFGKYLFREFPVFERLLAPLFPLYNAYLQFPFASIIIFFGLYLGIINNPQINRFVRFNAMQAILIDILLILPSVIESVLKPSMSLVITGYNTVWLYVFLCVMYGMGCCLLGEQPRLPLVADAADQQVR